MNTQYTLILNTVGSKFLSVAKVVSKVTGQELEEVLDNLENLPYTIGQNFSQKDAETLCQQLTEIGASVELLEPPKLVLKSLVLNAPGAKFLKVAKLISSVKNIDLEQVMDSIEECPYTIGEFPDEEFIKLKEQLEALGAEVASQEANVQPDDSKKADLKVSNSAQSTASVISDSSAQSTTIREPIPAKTSSSKPRPVSDSALTSKFEENWNLLEQEAERIKQEHLLPFSFTDIDGTTAERTAEELDAQMDSLKKEKFTISVCGMVKAGKSTFLNALLFGEDILPAFDTPMTAKLNFIEYTEEKNHFVVNFYDAKEWKELLGSLDPENLSQLNERIQLCAERHGIDQDEYIGAPPCKEMDLRKLEEYVSDPKSKKGKYTPFVKDVHIFVHNSSIKDVRIVDTPGLNDPNVINSRETTKWIKNTHALIFLLPNKGLDESSLKFFDTHLLGTRPSNRVWVINKIDDISDDDLQKTKAYIRQLGQQEEFKQKDLFGHDEKVCGYSALVAMLRNMYKKGMELNEDQMYHLDNVGDDFKPDPDNLGEVIGERLYQNTGIKRIVAGFTAINTLYSQHIKIAEKTILNCEMIIDDGKKSDEELQDEIKMLVEKQTSFQRQLENWKMDLNSAVFTAVKTEIDDKKQKLVDSLGRKMQMRVDSCNSVEQMRGLAYEFRDECTKAFGPFGPLAEGLNNCTMALRDELGMAVKRIRNLFAQNEIEGCVDFAPLENLNEIELSLDDLIEDADSKIGSALPDGFFSELFTSKETMRGSTKSAFSELVNNLRKELTDNSKEVQNLVNKQIADSFAEFHNNIENSILQKRSYLESGSADRRKALEEAQKELANAQELKERVGGLQREFKYQFPQEISMNN